MNPGKRFEDKFRESANPLGFTMRISDKVFKGAGGRILSSQSEADFLVVVGDDVFLVECKATCSKSLPMAKVERHQEETLALFDGLGPRLHGILAGEFYDRESYRRPKVCYLLPIADWFRYRRAVPSRASMPVTAFRELAVECPYAGSRYALDFGRWAV